jgi:hypothetical protein
MNFINLAKLFFLLGLFILAKFLTNFAQELKGCQI